MTKHERAPGEHYANDGKSVRLTSSDNDFPRDLGWHYVGTLTTARRSRNCATWPKSLRPIRPKAKKDIAPL